MAADNEGAAMVLVKVDGSGANATLTVSDRYYERFADQGALLNVHSVIDVGSVRKLWVYPVRQ